MIFISRTMVYILTTKQILQLVFISIVFKYVIVIEMNINNEIYFISSNYVLDYKTNID